MLSNTLFLENFSLNSSYSYLFLNYLYLSLSSFFTKLQRRNTEIKLKIPIIINNLTIPIFIKISLLLSKNNAENIDLKAAKEK